MIGTIINCAAIIIGGVIGLLIKKGINKNYENGINHALGIGVLVIGFNGIISSMFKTGVDGTISSNGELLLIISLVIGTLIGEISHLDDRINGFSKIIEKKLHMSGFSRGFVNATILFCVGAMAVIGALNDGLSGDSSVLIVKSTLDFTSSIILAASLGAGVIFSFIPILFYQGGISILAGFLNNILKGDLLTQISMVGYAIIICIGLNFVFAIKIKTINILPAIIIPALYAGIKIIFVS